MEKMIIDIQKQPDGIHVSEDIDSAEVDALFAEYGFEKNAVNI